jgi:serine/threonine protein kinase
VRGLARIAILGLALFALCGCGRANERVLELRDWTFVAPSGASRALTLPARVDRDLPQSNCEYTLRTHLELPRELRGERLTLAFPFLHARARLSVNGEEMVALSNAMREGYRGYTDQSSWRIGPETSAQGAIDLTLVVSYEHVMSAWIDVAPRLSDTEEGDRAFVAIERVNRTQGIVCIVVTLMTAFAYGLVYVRDRRRVAYGWFALQSVVGGAGYAILQDGESQWLFGAHENSVVPVLLTLGVLTSVEFTHAQFGLGRPSRFWRWALGGSIVVACALPTPFVGGRIVPLYSCAMTVLNVSYQVPTAARVYFTRGRSLAALVIGLSWVFVAVLGFPDIVAWAGLGEIAGGLRGACIGLALVALMQSMVLSTEHHAALARADGLNAELSTQLDAVSRLNEELRRQIGARADALALALAQASAPRPSELRALERGETVAKAYRVERAVGEGATGKVYEVTRIADGARLALKLLDPSSDATEMARFAREAQIIAQLDHPNVVRIADVDVTHEGFMFLVVEFVEGLSLRHHYGRARTLAWNVEVLAQVAEGLEAIHARGIVHRDLKPANVLVTSAPGDASLPRAKLADFGISSTGTLASEPPPALSPSAPVSQSIDRKIAAMGAPLSASRSKDEPTITGPSISTSKTGPTTSDSLLTQTGAWMGTPKYMAPELGGAAKHARPAADVFAFGVMAYELFTGKEPFEEPPAITRVKGNAFVLPAPLRATAGELDGAIVELIARCLAEDPYARPDAGELATAFRGAATLSARRAAP